MSELTVKMIHAQDYSEEGLAKLIEDIIAVERESLPKEWVLRDDRAYWKEVLCSKDCIAVVAMEGDIVAGIILGVPHNSCVAELHPDDPLFVEKDEPCIYVEIMEIAPKHQRKHQLFSRIIDVLFQEMVERDIYHFSTHARVATGFHRLLARKVKSLGFAVDTRMIGSWKWAGGEGYSYMEGSLHESFRTF